MGLKDVMAAAPAAEAMNFRLLDVVISTNLVFFFNKANRLSLRSAWGTILCASNLTGTSGSFVANMGFDFRTYYKLLPRSQTQESDFRIDITYYSGKGPIC